MRTRSTLALLASALLLGGCLTSGSIPQAQQFPLAPKFEVAKAAPTLHTLGLRPIAAARP